MALSEGKLLDDVRQRFFSPSTSSSSPLTIGIEAELIPVFAATRLPALPRPESGKSTADILSQIGKRAAWREDSGGGDPPSWTLSNGTRISFEPGGQIEVSSAPGPRASEVIAATRQTISLIRDGMRGAGIELVSNGVDPFNDIDAVPLQLRRDRYARMTRFFESIGPSGVRMMRQTAAVQINIERGAEPERRWTLLNALAPYVVALFANSSRYAGKPTAHASYRAHLWRTLDSSRTGIPCDAADPAKRYLDFALDANAIASDSELGQWEAFREWMARGHPNESDWSFHLTTLFPEVRPKEFFEIRSADAVDPDSLAAPVVFVAGLIYDEESATDATKLVGSPDEQLLERAGRSGLADPDIRAVVVALTKLALSGAEKLGEDYLVPRDIEIAREYFDSRI